MMPVIGMTLISKKLKFLFLLLLKLCSRSKTTLLVRTMIDYNEDRKDLQVDKLFEDFIEDCEKKAAELEIPVDYYIAEFT